MFLIVQKKLMRTACTCNPVYMKEQKYCICQIPEIMNMTKIPVKRQNIQLLKSTTDLF